MDPSYNSGFGSFGNGGGQPQQPVVSGGVQPQPQQPFVGNEMQYGGVVPVSSDAQQDIILSPTGEKKSKKWLVVILLLVGLGLIAGAVAFVLWKGNIIGGDVTDFEELVSYIENVPEDYDWSWLEEGDSEERNWIYAVLVIDDEPGVIRNYYDELEVRYEKFLDGSGKRIPTELSKKYGNVLTILNNAMNYQERRRKLLLEYDNGGLDSAQEYINNKLKCSEDGDIELIALCKFETDYYDSILEKYEEDEDELDLVKHTNRFHSFSSRLYLNNLIKRMNLEILENLNA